MMHDIIDDDDVIISHSCGTDSFNSTNQRHQQHQQQQQQQQQQLILTPKINDKRCLNRVSVTASPFPLPHAISDRLCSNEEREQRINAKDYDDDDIILTSSPLQQHEQQQRKHNDEEVTSPLSFIDAFDCQSLQRSLKRVKLSSKSFSYSSAPSSCSPQESKPLFHDSSTNSFFSKRSDRNDFTDSSSLTTAHTHHNSHLPTNLHQPQQQQYNCKHNHPGQIRLERDIEHATSVPATSDLWIQVSSSEENKHSNEIYEIVHRNSYDDNITQSTSIPRCDESNSNVYITITRDAEANPMILILDVYCRNHYNAVGTYINQGLRSNADSSTAAGTSAVTVSINVPRFYPHVPPEILSIQYHTTSNSIPIDRRKVHQNHLKQQQLRHNNTNLSCRWIAGNYDRYRNGQILLNSSTTKCFRKHGGKATKHFYRLKYPYVKEIIVVSNPEEEGDDLYNTDDDRGTNRSSDSIVYVKEWTPIHRISDVVHWIVDSIIEPIDTTTTSSISTVTTLTEYEIGEANSRTPHRSNIKSSRVIATNHDDCKDVKKHGRNFEHLPQLQNQHQHSLFNPSVVNNISYCGDGVNNMTDDGMTKIVWSTPNGIHNHLQEDNTVDDSFENMEISIDKYCETASSFLNPNRFYVGYRSNIEKSAICTANATKCSAELMKMSPKRLGRDAILGQKPINSGRQQHHRASIGYWNNRPNVTASISLVEEQESLLSQGNFNNMHLIDSNDVLDDMDISIS